MGRIVKGIIMGMMVVVMGCNSGGVSGEGTGGDGKVRKGDGSVIDLKVVGEKIKSAVEFAGKVKEVHVLVKSVDELAKAIGKKIKDSDQELDALDGKNGSLMAGVFQIILTVKGGLTKLETDSSSVTEKIKTKITDAKTKSVNFLKKLQEKNTDLGKEDVSNADAEKAIDYVKQKDGDKGAKELGELNKAVDELLVSSNKIVSDAIAELVVKPIT
ncbi:Vsp/OspC family lipoprotein (plasmid) [Borrelia recurrentis]|uniref:Vsp protein n=1 Tax=Borrelia recurrentis (strain A1) TaxID=412418 RepID=B5RS84_BORRA|nr:Vsp/OspC family lipoprotein [Borrelia recurrentis]ACH95220.1 vsp protein [Borrelia recurrentis A1]ACH95248.1 vsp protein [Borrelia recurrentis A1]